jgi:thiol peroxidase
MDAPYNGLVETSGRVRIIASVPSLDTEICYRETRRFNENASGLSDDVVILVISMDFTFAQKRYCGSAGINRVITLSDHVSRNFGKNLRLPDESSQVITQSCFCC